MMYNASIVFAVFHLSLLFVAISYIYVPCKLVCIQNDNIHFLTFDSVIWFVMDFKNIFYFKYFKFLSSKHFLKSL